MGIMLKVKIIGLLGLLLKAIRTCRKVVLAIIAISETFLFDLQHVCGLSGIGLTVMILKHLLPAKGLRYSVWCLLLMVRACMTAP